MLRKNFLIFLLILAVALPAFAQNQNDVDKDKKDDAQQESLQVQGKNYNFSLGVNGGVIDGHFCLAGDMFYVQKFGKGRGLFQIAGFALKNKEMNEYGLSVGVGARSDEGISFYLFADSLYHKKFFVHVRPVVEVRLNRVAFSAWYAHPFSIDSRAFQINGENVVAAKQFGAQLDLVPFSWARIYASLMFVQNKHSSYRIGAEVRIRWVAISANYYKTDSAIHSYWHSYDNVHISLKLILGENSLNPTRRASVPVAYPVLINKPKEEPGPDPEPNWADYEIMYKRVLTVINADAPDPSGWFSIWHGNFGGTNSSRLQSYGENKWIAEVTLEYDSKTPYAFWTGDRKVETVYGENIARKIYIREKGDVEWTEITYVEKHGLSENGEWAKALLTKSGIRIPSK